MKKIETIWRELLYQAIEKNNRRFTQKAIAAKFGFSTSTVFQALKIPRKMGAARVSGRHFVLEDVEKLLYYWASVRNIQKDRLAAGYSSLSPFEIEAGMPPDVVFAGFSAAYKLLKGQVPADYDSVYVYSNNSDSVLERFEIKKRVTNRQQSIENIFVFSADKHLKSYGQITTLAQTFVDLWNMPSWYAKDYANAIKNKIDGLLS